MVVHSTEQFSIAKQKTLLVPNTVLRMDRAMDYMTSLRFQVHDPSLAQSSCTNKSSPPAASSSHCSAINLTHTANRLPPFLTISSMISLAPS